MTLRQVCDRCEAFEGEAPFTKVSMSMGHNSLVMDVCPECESIVAGIMQSRICTTKTPDAVWVAGVPSESEINEARTHLLDKIGKEVGGGTVGDSSEAGAEGQELV
jgi:hypothetical protein